MRFGLFNQGESEPIEEYKGDSIQIVQPQVIEVIRERGFHDMPTAIAYIHLGPRQLGQQRQVICQGPLFAVRHEIRLSATRALQLERQVIKMVERGD
jgi:hypothetical protein